MRNEKRILCVGNGLKGIRKHWRNWDELRFGKRVSLDVANWLIENGFRPIHCDFWMFTEKELGETHEHWGKRG